MKTIWRSFFCAMAVSLAVAGAAWAVPSLQIDVEGGLYDAVDESTYNTADTYDLYALMNETNKTDLSDTYYVSMALLKPDDADWADDFGSFSFAGVSYDDLSQFSWGTPSLLTSIELGSHGIFPSYFTEHAFSFSSGNKAKSYDVETNPGGFETWSGSGSYLYYAAFEVDVSQLVSGWQVHFDLYNSSAFAPYSHDAYANPPGKPPGDGVPEPATMLLFGTGLAGLAGYHRKKKAAN